MSDDQPQRARPSVHEWKIRSMSTTDSAAAVQAASNAKRSTADWLGEAIREKLAREREPMAGEVLSPDQPPPSPGIMAGDATHGGAAHLTPSQIVEYLRAYQEYLGMRGLTLPTNGQVMRQADRLIREAMEIGGMAVPRRLPGPSAGKDHSDNPGS